MPLTAVNSAITEGSPGRVPRRPHLHTQLDEDYGQGPADSTDSGVHEHRHKHELGLI